MDDTSFQEAVLELVKKDSRYPAEAYYFLREGLDFTVKALKKNAHGAARHVSGKELCEGLRDHALQEFGPMALSVLNAWGITRTEDFGELVFNLVAAGRLGKTERDRKEDFADGYDFHETFAKPYEADAVAKRRPRRPRSRGR
ncbi:MAG: hypothetical protein PHR35_07725 [Kiritimatiellae bacterium]|nr:hypothetical protein [Kiritimatiellia bacterium]